MNLNYLTEVVLPQRKSEIEKGKNLATRNPIYVVLKLEEKICEGHINYLHHSINGYGKSHEYGYYDDAEMDDREFSTSDEGMKDPVAVTRFFVDRFIAFFLTSEAAHDYLKYQKHNLGEAYVFVFCAGYSNQQMDKLLNE